MRFRWRWRRAIKGDGGENANPYSCQCPSDQKRTSLPLSDVPTGAKVRICCLEGNGALIRRLAEMGFTPGTEIKLVRRAPLNDPIEFCLRGYLVSLRREEAQLILVRPVEEVSEEEVSDLSSDQISPV